MLAAARSGIAALSHTPTGPTSPLLITAKAPGMGIVTAGRWNSPVPESGPHRPGRRGLGTHTIASDS
ncbi:hypothetical protein RW1_022_00970 [Rhodococcus wratislaviensis NBRC 100605]|uniref:Uncharacterized protein n=1 Tax=Rhodococcus wratislaviensis NBRC 100605 TaxID=1219028 RepID=X0Q399_RHOWR|nr:hypothetical protein RW1_022_00970 [Rhodococcus wratislaviensis NBRC 100605]